MTARHTTTCPACGNRIVAGEHEITKRGGQWVHQHCPPAVDGPPREGLEELPTVQQTTRAGRQMIAGEVVATVVMANGQHVTVQARGLRRTDEGWERVGLLDDGCQVRVSTGRHGQRIGWIKQGFAIDWDRALTDDIKQATRALFMALASSGVREELDIEHPDNPGHLVPDDTPLGKGLAAVFGRIEIASRCGRCGRRLTDPESIERGIAPECARKATTSRHAPVYEPAAATPELEPDTGEVRADLGQPTSVAAMVERMHARTAAAEREGREVRADLSLAARRIRLLDEDTRDTIAEALRIAGTETSDPRYTQLYVVCQEVAATQ